VLATAAFCAASRAGVSYDFSGVVNMFGVAEMFHYTSQAFIDRDTFVPASALDSCSTGQGLPCFGVNFLPSGPDTPQHYPELTFQTTNPDNSVGTAFYYFPLGSSFAAYGILTNVPSLGNTGTLTISATVPEPANTFAVVLGILVLLGGAGLLACPRREIHSASRLEFVHQCVTYEHQ
jgi:hypothetical protein